MLCIYSRCSGQTWYNVQRQMHSAGYVRVKYMDSRSVDRARYCGVWRHLIVDTTACSSEKTMDGAFTMISEESGLWGHL